MMKREHKYVIIILSIIIVCIIVIVFFNIQKKNNKTAIHEMYFHSRIGSYEMYLADFFINNGRYPYSSKELIDSINNQHDIELGDFNIFRQDLFSKKGELLRYYPLYDRKGNCVSFLILSSGIDGKFNTPEVFFDTVYLDSWWNKIDVYNYFEDVLMRDHDEKICILSNVYDFPEINNYPIPYPKVDKFNLWNYCFGRKDYVVQVDLLFMTTDRLETILNN